MSDLGEPKTREERRALLARQINASVARGRRVESQGDYRAVLVRRQWGIVDRREIVTVDEWGNVLVEKV